MTPEISETRPTEERVREINRLIGRLGDGATVLVRTVSKTRRLTVERQVQEYDGTPEWTGRCINPEKESAVVLSGYGTEYILTGHRDNDRHPSLQWPSCRGSCVWDLVVDERGEQLKTDETAIDLIPELRYDGR